MSFQVLKLDRHVYGIKAPGSSLALTRVRDAIPGLSGTGKMIVGSSDAIEAGANMIRANKLNIADTDLDPKVWGEPLATPALKDLRDYQKIGVNFLLTHAGEGCILADDMGLGKTCQTIRAARAWRAKTVVVCPKIVRSVWEDELHKWWPDAKVVVLTGKPKEVIPENANFVLIHYEILYLWVDAINAWAARLVVFDECQAVSGFSLEEDRTSRRGQAAVAIQAPLRIGLSGTPMTNRPRDLWGVFGVICPNRFGKKFFSFGLRYCDAHKEEVAPTKTVWKFDGASRTEELKRRLEWLMLRRRVEDVNLELPPIIRQTVWLDSPQKKKQTWAAPKSLRELRGLLDRAADRKLPEVLPMIFAARAAGTVVVFCYRRLVAEWFADQLKLAGETRVEMIHGGSTTLQRVKRLETAKNWDLGGILIVTIDLMGVGISLAFARSTIFAELSYEPWKLRQAERRVARFGQKGSSVLVQYPLMRGTADELVLDRVISKLDVEGDLGLGDGGKMRAGFEQNEEAVLNEIFNF